MLHKNNFYAIGLMSGSSLDGLDICYVQFKIKSPSSLAIDFKNQLLEIDYTILNAECIEYTTVFRERLRNAVALSAFDFAKLHTEIGQYFGRLTQDFIKKNNISALDFICSHGQTIFHQPALGFTTQIGCGAQIAAQTHTKVICDLRTSDIAYGGQGAPIVPIAEKYLFPAFSVFLNIGGIANISFKTKNNKGHKTIAFDVCAANTVLNYLAKKKNMDYDENGKLAKTGKINDRLLQDLEEINFCKKSPPKSLGSEHVYEDWIELVEKYTLSVEDKLATMVEHIAGQVGRTIKAQLSSLNIEHNAQIFITGGGALNTFLIGKIQQHSPVSIVIPDKLTVQYKEALAMAFIGLLRNLELPNSFASVTGATKNTIGGAEYLP